MKALTEVVRELEAHAAEKGWDQHELLFALVETSDLVQREPELAQQLGIDDEDGLTPIEQEAIPEGLEDLLAQIIWPDEVAGCAAVVERLVLPPEADDAIPEDPEEARQFAAAHPERQEVRIVAAALRSGESACALRLRSHDEADSVLTGPDLVPALLNLLHSTLDPEETKSDE